MKKFLLLCLCCLFGVALFAKEKTHSILFLPQSGDIEFLSYEKAVYLEPKAKKSGGHWYRIYYLAGKQEWEEIKLVIRPGASGTIKINLRAPGGSVAEYSSFAVDGKEQLQEPVLIPYQAKGQEGVWIECSGEKDKDITITAKIRRSPRKLSEFKAEE